MNHFDFCFLLESLLLKREHYVNKGCFYILHPYLLMVLLSISLNKLPCQNRILSFIVWFVLHFYGVFITKHLLPFLVFFESIIRQSHFWIQSTLLFPFYGVLLSNCLFFGFFTKLFLISIKFVYSEKATKFCHSLICAEIPVPSVLADKQT